MTRSSDPNDNRLGGELLRQLVRTDHSNIRVLSMYAFNAFEQQRFGEAVAAWEMMLKLLPANDTRRAVIERSIAQEKDITSCFDRQLLRDFFGTFHDTLVNP